MTCRDKVVTCIKAPRQSSTSFKVGLVLLPLNLILFLVSFSTDKWLESSTLYSIGGVNYTARHQGLWRYCQDTSGVECCGNLDDVIGLHSHSIPGKNFQAKSRKDRGMFEVHSPKKKQTTSSGKDWSQQVEHSFDGTWCPEE